MTPLSLSRKKRYFAAVARVIYPRRIWALIVLLPFCIASEWYPGAAAPAVSVSAIRIASFNTSLNRPKAGELVTDLATRKDPQAQKIAAILQQVRPDVIALMEFDYDATGKALQYFQDYYLAVSQQGGEPLHYGYTYAVPANTGIPAGTDLNNDHTVSLPQDAIGFGRFEGQYAFALLSRYEIKTEAIRSFQHFLWKDMPQAHLPHQPDGQPWYTPEALAVLRLSSKNHIDLPVQLPHGTVVHVILAHPTPPVFDGPEDRNGTRNYDEIRLLNDYVSNQPYLYDDAGQKGGLPAGESFVIMGDMNADPQEGDSSDNPIDQFKNNPHIHPGAFTGKHIPASKGAVEASSVQGGINKTHQGNPAYDTGDFNDTNPGNLRIDYVLPSKNATIKDAGVCWPVSSDPQAAWITASDHRLVWLDVAF